MMIPKNTILTEWAASLIVDFPNDAIPALKDEDDWKEWGNELIQENSFASNAAPSPQFYETWEPWAQAVFVSMVNY